MRAELPREQWWAEYARWQLGERDGPLCANCGATVVEVSTPTDIRLCDDCKEDEVPETTHGTPERALGRVIIMRLRVEPDDNDTRSDMEIANAISDQLSDTDGGEALPGIGIAIATPIPDDPANRPRRVG